MRGEGLGFPVSRIRRSSRADLVDTTAVREHIARLESVGMSIAMIARAAGITDTQISLYKSGQPSTRRGYAAAVLAVDGRPSKHQAYVLAVGSVRRLQGLARIGYTLEQIATEVGMSWSSLSRVRCSTGAVLWETHVAVRDVFNRLGIDGGSEIARQRAIRKGWVHPFEWTDIDDPFEVPSAPEESGLPDPVVVERLMAGQPTNATREERKAAFFMLRESGMSVNAAADMAHISPRTAERYSNLEKGVAA
ncbi:MULTISPECIES: hypothetical protein [unclassified Rhodococcus (in: high G+C Gram-positive bacteria)]|uniref:hypothetical protein n=2 Tax=Rhodococcus TaxID=1827 RepID=UPI00113FE266|nr:MULTISPECIES: hypothetical protein [unclassified Rhodococcus (in: high G+C Gram-positive bacteria)]